MRFAALGSGSKGNAWVVEAGATRVLLDCGFGPRELARRLARLGLALDAIDAILITHEHSDHVGGILRGGILRGGTPRRRTTWPRLLMSRGTATAAGLLGQAEIIDSHNPIVINALEIHPYPVPHDTREPVQFVFKSGARQLGILTDTGHITPHIVRMLSAVDALAIECNHDAEMLRNGPYPPLLKRRISGDYGHLDNAAAAALLRQLDPRRLQHVVCAHLSERNNHPRLARAALAAALNCTPDWIAVADQENGLDWRMVE